jgi:hypothetical protein
MSYQNIDATISAADVQAVTDALNTIKQKLGFLVTLSNEERKSLFKTGAGRLSFIVDAAGIAQNFASIFPPSFDTAAFLRDVELFQKLNEIKLQIDSLASQVDDTCVALGSEAGQQSLQVYDYGKAAQDTVPGLRPVMDQLGQHFERSRKAAAAPETKP